jgi:hypothetical protein
MVPAADRWCGEPPVAVVPRQSSPLTGKLSARPAGRPGCVAVKESLRRSLQHHCSTVACHTCEAPRWRFRKAWRNLSVRWRGQPLSLAGSHCLPPAVPGPSSRTRREDHVLLIVRMSSGRLFLDRVARQQSPSPLHRHPQHSTHSSEPMAKHDISTLQRTRHFYFALTGVLHALTPRE